MLLSGHLLRIAKQVRNPKPGDKDTVNAKKIRKVRADAIRRINEARLANQKLKP